VRFLHSEVLLTTKRPSTLVPLLAAILATGCFGTEPDAIRASLTGNVENTSLSVADTLVIRRTVQNLGKETIWLDVSSAQPPADITTAGGEPACHLGLTTLSLGLRSIAPGAIVELEQKRPLSWLQNCQPGTYRIAIMAVLYDTENGPPGPYLLLQSEPRELVIRPR
jgi:hypothetical protein